MRKTYFIKWLEPLVIMAMLLSGTFSQCPDGCKCQGGRVQCNNLTLESVPVNVKETTTHLNLSHNRIKNLRDYSFKNLINLTTLDLSNNNIETIEENTFNGLNNLRRLDLHDNLLTTVPVLALQKLPRISQLTMYDNNIQKITQMSFLSNTQLMVLDLNGNDIETIHPSAFKGLTNITSLYLQENNLRDIPSDQLMDTPKLKVINISSNPIERIQNDPPFRHTPDLQFLFMNNVSVFKNNDLISEHTFKRLKNLKALTLDYNDLFLVPRALSPLGESLEVLSLRGNLFWTILDDSFENMTNLVTLMLSNANIEYIDDFAFDGLNNLKYLDLRDNKMTLLYPELVFQPVKQAVILLDGNPWACYCGVEQLQSWAQNRTPSPNIICVEPPELNNRTLLSIPKSNLYCFGPFILNNHGPVNEIQTTIGGNATIRCQVVGVPLPDINYVELKGDPMPDNRTLISEDRLQITITDVHESDEGIVGCIASHQGGNAVAIYEIKIKRPEGFTTIVYVLAAVLSTCLLVIGLLFTARLIRAKRLTSNPQTAEGNTSNSTETIQQTTGAMQNSDDTSTADNRETRSSRNRYVRDPTEVNSLSDEPDVVISHIPLQPRGPNDTPCLVPDCVVRTIEGSVDNNASNSPGARGMDTSIGHENNVTSVINVSENINDNAINTNDNIIGATNDNQIFITSNAMQSNQRQGNGSTGVPHGEDRDQDNARANRLRRTIHTRKLQGPIAMVQEEIAETLV